MANYEPIASIPAPTIDFNFTLAEDGKLKKKIKEELFISQPNSPNDKRKVLKPETKLPRIVSKQNRM